jgi:hypothetical protein
VATEAERRSGSLIASLIDAYTAPANAPGLLFVGCLDMAMPFEYGLRRNVPVSLHGSSDG